MLTSCDQRYKWWHEAQEAHEDQGTQAIPGNEIWRQPSDAGRGTRDIMLDHQRKTQPETSQNQLKIKSPFSKLNRHFEGSCELLAWCLNENWWQNVDS